jgi:hypothetical protein
MAISDYTSLKQAVANWVDATNDISAGSERVAEFIALAEADFNRRLRVRPMEDSTTVAPTRTAALPASFLQLRTIRRNNNTGGTLDYLPPDQFWTDYGDTSVGEPEAYTIEGENLVFGPASNGTTVIVSYYKPIAALTTSATTNWMLTNHPDVYLYGALVAAEPFVHDDKRMPMWKTLYEEAIKQVDESDKNDRHGSGLVMRPSTWA